jgi:hypothetical protein
VDQEEEEEVFKVQDSRWNRKYSASKSSSRKSRRNRNTGVNQEILQVEEEVVEQELQLEQMEQDQLMEDPGGAGTDIFNLWTRTS